MHTYLLGALFFIEVIIALLMVGVVMLQPPKDQGGGLGATFGGGMGEEVFGGHVSNVLSRTTIVLGVVLILNTLGIAILMRGGVQGSTLADRAMPVQEAPAAPVPATPAQ